MYFMTADLQFGVQTYRSREMVCEHGQVCGLCCADPLIFLPRSETASSPADIIDISIHIMLYEVKRMGISEFQKENQV